MRAAPNGASAITVCARWPASGRMTFTQQDVVFIACLLAEAARTEIMPRFKALADGDVRHKTSVFDPVTAADEAAELVISAALADRSGGRTMLIIATLAGGIPACATGRPLALA